MRDAEFRQFLVDRGLAEATIETTIYALKRIENAYGFNLDTEYDRDQLASLISSFTYSIEDGRLNRPNPSRMEIDSEKLYRRLTWYRHKIRLYIAFRSGSLPDAISDQSVQNDDDETDRTFSLERDLQASLRSNIEQLEAGLAVADNGMEVRVEAGLIDILAKDRDGRWVVIELKADIARPSAVTQLLAYMGCLATERGGDVRGILIAADFDPRIPFAVRAVANVILKRYRFRFMFQ